MTPTPHDALFKATFSQPEHAAAALREVLSAAVAARIGEREGRQAGRLEGQRSALLKQLRLRFGELPGPVVARVRAADAAQIEGWIERVITSPTLEDVLTER
ncbi:DUF4351 domain-containing protein [Sorangium sp. So ce118]